MRTRRKRNTGSPKARRRDCLASRAQLAHNPHPLRFDLRPAIILDKSTMVHSDANACLDLVAAGFGFARFSPVATEVGFGEDFASDPLGIAIAVWLVVRC